MGNSTVWAHHPVQHRQLAGLLAEQIAGTGVDEVQWVGRCIGVGVMKHHGPGVSLVGCHGYPYWFSVQRNSSWDLGLLVPKP